MKSFEKVLDSKQKSDPKNKAKRMERMLLALAMTP
jgi:hypothetical protein